ncbi:hypothetical protein T10_9438 [Trichinella papuae]|uniref:Uncharacterized protein n=1 Tax=Trichinella papuae TaxID=268474 RepID=A0A0V1MN29_9BILA|nr:hypothetical protein T10_9438 [Trichinella papuae]
MDKCRNKADEEACLLKIVIKIKIFPAFLIFTPQLTVGAARLHGAAAAAAADDDDDVSVGAFLCCQNRNSLANYCTASTTTTVGINSYHALLMKSDEVETQAHHNYCRITIIVGILWLNYQ